MMIAPNTPPHVARELLSDWESRNGPLAGESFNKIQHAIDSLNEAVDQAVEKIEAAWRDLKNIEPGKFKKSEVYTYFRNIAANIDSLMMRLKEQVDDFLNRFENIGKNILASKEVDLQMDDLDCKVEYFFYRNNKIQENIIFLIPQRKNPDILNKIPLKFCI